METTEPLSEVAEASSDDPNIVVVEAGPLDRAAQAQMLTPTAPMPFIADVSLRGVMKGDAHFVRISVRMRSPGRHALRVSGRHVYIDVMPLTDTPAAIAPASSGATTPLKAEGPPALKPGGAPADGPVPVSAEEAATAYRSLEPDIVRRAHLLAARPDVKGLEALRAEVDRRDRELGFRQPELVDRLRNELEQRLSEARELQLKMDGIAMRKATGKEARQQ